MLANKDVQGVLEPFADRAAGVHGVPVSGHAHHSPADISAAARAMNLEAEAAMGIEAALISIASVSAKPAAVLILGSLYLAGEVLRKNRQPPG